MIDIEKLEKLMAQATPGPWEVKTLPTNPDFNYAASDRVRSGMVFHASAEDTTYIVTVCNSLPDLIAENRALQERAQMRQELVEQYEKDIARLRQKVRELETQRDYLLDKVIIEDNTDDIDYCPIPVDYPCSYRSKCGWGCETGSREQRKGCWIKALEEVIVI